MSDKHELAKALEKALEAAQTAPDFLEALARAVWHNDHDGADCPDDGIPTVAALARWWPELRPDDTAQEYKDRALALCQAANERYGEGPDPMDLGIAAHRIGTPASEISYVAFSVLWAINFPREIKPADDRNEGCGYLVHYLRERGGGRFSRGWADATEHVGKLLSDVHTLWRLLRHEGVQKPHPLAPIVRAWQERPRRVQRNTRRTRILPSRVGMVSADHPRANRLFSVAARAAPPDPLGGQLALPGFGDGEEYGKHGPVLPLILYRLGEDRQHGKGAPLPLRLWVEGVRSVPELDRGRPVYMEVTLRELMQALWPGTHLRPGEYLPKLAQAARTLDSWEARFPWEDPVTGKGGLRRVVSVADFPRGETYLDDVFALTVHLPPGAKDGPMMPEALNAWGAHSALAYVGLINLHLRWFDPGVTRVPVGKNKSHWVQTQDPARYPDLSDEDLLDIFMPVRDARPVRRHALRRIRTTIKELEAAHGLRSDGRKLLPPEPGTELGEPPKRAGKLPTGGSARAS